MLGRHLVHGWELALAEVAVFEEQGQASNRQCLLAPYLRGAIIPEQRQVVRIVDEGGRTRVNVEPTAPVAHDSPREKQNEESFFSALPAELREFANGLVRQRSTCTAGYAPKFQLESSQCIACFP